jgi:hypothetical protein
MPSHQNPACMSILNFISSSEGLGNKPKRNNIEKVIMGKIVSIPFPISGNGRGNVIQM